MKKMVNGSIVDMSEEDIAQYNEDQKNAPKEFDVKMEYLRERRNILLQKTDWTSSSDLTMSDEMKTYRQALRDATNGLDTVEKVDAYTFPTEVLK
tara:strand:- start:2275 stop:2559 length:285 start_codon:yes stop_codon:yes gene_type:complete